MVDVGFNGFQPGQSPSDRRAAFDLRRRLATQGTTLESLQAQVDALPLGLIGYAARTTNAGPIGAAAAIGGLTFAIPVVAGRAYRVEAFVSTLLNLTVAGEEVYMFLTVNGSTIEQARGTQSTTKNTSTMHAAAIYAPVASATVTFSVSGQALSGNVTFFASAVQPMWLGVYDEGAL